jgi:hypothetical protein
MRRLSAFVLGLLILVCGTLSATGQTLRSGAPGLYLGSVPQRGVFEVVLFASSLPGNPFVDVEVLVTFRKPSGETVEVDGFFDGDGIFRARAYVAEMGLWRWEASSTLAELNGRSGEFRVVPSNLPGKLRLHPRDPRQFAFENGEWFLHIGDTGYRYVVASEPFWQAYLDQAAARGFTKIRTWFAQSRHNVEALFTPERDGLALPYWQEIERRVLYALQQHPHVNLQLIPFAEDSEEIRRYGAGDQWARYLLRYAQARWSAFPNVQWTFSNDQEIVRDATSFKGRQVPWEAIDQMGNDMAAREPWGTLLSNHQMRFSGYDFLEAAWSHIVTLEDLDQVTGQLLLDYRSRSQKPVVLDEDRYELYRHPANRRYFFRRLMWASLLSGGHPTYGGLRTYEPYDQTGTRGVWGYDDANRAGLLHQGAHDFAHIHQFFHDAALTLVGMEPCDDRAGAQPRRVKCIGRDGLLILYLANPDGDKPETDNPATAIAAAELRVPNGRYALKWFDPTTARWTDGGMLQAADDAPLKLKAPARAAGLASGDWVALLRRQM